MWRTMFSRTTIASSIRIPIASDNPSSDMVLRVKPNAQTTMNDASTDTGRARPVITGDSGGAVALGFGDVDADGFSTVVERERTLLLGAVDCVRHLAQPHDSTPAFGDDE